MSNDISDLSDTIIAKSDQLNADDLIVAKTITVSAVKRGGVDDPVIIHYNGDCGRPYKPCKTMRRVIVAAWGSNGNEWIGRSLTVYCDPSVKWAGKEVGGIRISHMSDITKGMTIKLSVTRGQKKEYRIEPLVFEQKPPYPDFEKAFAGIKKFIESGKMTPEQAITKCEQTGTLTDAQKKQIRDLVNDDETESSETSEDEIFDS